MHKILLACTLLAIDGHRVKKDRRVKKDSGSLQSEQDGKVSGPKTKALLGLGLGLGSWVAYQKPWAPAQAGTVATMTMRNSGNPVFDNAYAGAAADDNWYSVGRGQFSPAQEALMYSLDEPLAQEAMAPAKVVPAARAGPGPMMAAPEEDDSKNVMEGDATPPPVPSAGDPELLQAWQPAPFNNREPTDEQLATATARDLAPKFWRNRVHVYEDEREWQEMQKAYEDVHVGRGKVMLEAQFVLVKAEAVLEAAQEAFDALQPPQLWKPMEVAFREALAMREMPDALSERVKALELGGPTEAKLVKAQEAILAAEGEVIKARNHWGEMITSEQSRNEQKQSPRKGFMGHRTSYVLENWSYVMFSKLVA